MIPIIPRPIIEAVAESVEPALCRIFEHGRRYSSSRLMSSAGLLLYRWYEAHADYASARETLDVLLNAATTERDEPEIARLTNNYGYEYLLESQFSRAEPYFIRSLALFERLGSFTEINNSRANLLTCRFGMLAADRWDELLPELKQVNHAFSSLGHWHARKTLILLARRAEHRGNRPAAIKWAQRAVKASGERPTHHRLEDQSYLHFLENQSSEHWRRQSPPASADRRNTQIRSEAPE